MSYRIEYGWIIDKNNNRASISYWGDQANAEASLLTLEDCVGCTDCVGCRDCTSCTDCTDCTYCTGCTSCTGCRDCDYCTGCRDCAGCRNCEDEIDLYSGKVFKAPRVDDLHQRVWEAVQVEDSFDMSNWHQGDKTPEHPCGTTHCWAGHIIAQAGAEGKALQDKTNPEFAAKQIAKVSSLPVNPAHFYDIDNARSLKRIEEMAERERENER